MEKFNEYHYWDKDYEEEEEEEEEEEISFDSNVNVQLTKLLQEFPKDVVKKAFEEIDSIYQITDPNTAYNHLVKIIQSNFVSVKKRRKCQQEPEKPWITRGIRKSITVRNKLFRKKEFGLFKLYRGKIKHLINISKEKNFRSEVEKTKDIISKWKVINKYLERTNDLKKCFTGDIDELNDFFVNIGSNLSNKIPHLTRKSGISIPNSFFLSEITTIELELIIKKLNNNKARGYDNISVKLIKLILIIILAPLCYVFNLCLTKGTVPDGMKIAEIVPIYKNDGSLDDPNNFRPISLLPILSKIFEICISSRLSNFLERNSLFSKSQFGFRRGKSTEIAILDLIETVSDNEPAVATFLDLKKAFDTVDTKILLDILFEFGVRGKEINLFSSYLRNRYCRTKLGNMTSDSKLISCGVPQGSALSPLLFIIYINNIASLNLEGKIILFADDTVIINKGIDAVRKTNSDLIKIRIFLQSHKLSINTSKTEYMYFNGDNTETIKFHEYSCEMKNCCCPPLKKVNCFKYLGLHIDNKLTFNTHINKTHNIIKKYSKCLNIISDNNFRRTVFHAFVQSFILYANLSIGQPKLLIDLQNKLIKTHKINKILSLSSLYLYKKIKFVRHNYLPIECLSPPEKVTYNLYTQDSNIDFRKKFYNNNYIVNVYKPSTVQGNNPLACRVATNNFGQTITLTISIIVFLSYIIYLFLY